MNLIGKRIDALVYKTLVYCSERVIVTSSLASVNLGFSILSPSSTFRPRPLLTKLRPMNTKSIETPSIVSKLEQLKTVVICGPSGSGKTTLLLMLTNHFKNCFEYCVSYTTRKPRDKEENGKAYYFVEMAKFKEMIKNFEFVEYAEFSGNLYGTSKGELARVKKSGRIPILDLDLRGVQSLKAINFEAKYLFITAPSFESLERNLRKRGSETDDHIRSRLQHAKDDMESAREVDFDLVVVNRVIEDAFDEIRNFVQPEVDRLKQLTKS